MDKYLRKTYALGADRYITSDELVRHELCNEIQWKLNKLLVEIELSCSRFITDSHLNQRWKNWTLHPDWIMLKKVLHHAEQIKRQTQWYFDITIWSTLSGLGYWRHMTWNRDQYDLGWFVKGRTIDQLSQVLKSYSITHYTINAGGDMLCQWKTQKVHIQHPLDATSFIGEIEVTNSSLCTSSIRPRRRRPAINDINNVSKGTFFHHITSDWASAVWPVIGVSAIHTDAMIADAAATIFLVCPVQEVQKIAKTLEVEFLIVFDDMSSIQSPNFPLFINK